MGTESTVVTVSSNLPDDGSPGDACLVVINGDDLGKKYDLDGSGTVIGRASKVDIHIDEDAISRSHAVIEQRDNRMLIRDLESTNGTFVNNQSVDEEKLRDGDQIKIGRTIFKFLSGDNVETAYHDEIYRLTTTDGLTNIHNKRYLLQEMKREVSRSIRYGRDLCLLMCDLDRFKQINDTYGHLAGDQILRDVADRIDKNIRRDDLLARYGGEEFALLIPEISKEDGVQIAEKLRELIASEPFEFDGTTIPVTISIGVAEVHEYFEHKQLDADNDDNVDCLEFIQIADSRLYEAKEAGRNRVEA